MNVIQLTSAMAGWSPSSKGVHTHARDRPRDRAARDRLRAGCAEPHVRALGLARVRATRRGGRAVAPRRGTAHLDGRDRRSRTTASGSRTTTRASAASSRRRTAPAASTTRSIPARTSTTPASAVSSRRRPPAPTPRASPPSSNPSPEFESSGDEFVLIPDGASPSSDVVRADWNPDTGLFEFRDIIAMNADTGEDRPRPVAVSAAPDGNAYVVFQRSGTIQRIVDPESPTRRSTSSPPRRTAAARAPSPRRTAPAARCRRRASSSPRRPACARSIGTATDPAAPRTTVDSGFDLPGAQLVSALTYEIVDAAAGTGDLYAGTADSLPAAEGDANADRVFRWQSSGLPTQVADGLSTVGGFGPRHGGGLLVLDDPAIVTPGDPVGTGRMFSVGAAWARIKNDQDRRHGRLRDGPRSPSPARRAPVLGRRGRPAGTARPRSRPTRWTTATTRSPSAPPHPMEEIRRFTVDTTAPKTAPMIVSPAEKVRSRPARPYFSSTRPTASGRGPTSARSRASATPRRRASSSRVRRAARGRRPRQRRVHDGRPRAGRCGQPRGARRQLPGLGRR